MAKSPRINPLQKIQKAKKNMQFSMISRLAKALAKEFTLQSVFKLGYRNKEDISNLPPYVLSIGSQNVLTNAAEQVVIRNGYSLDGAAGNQNTYGIDSAYDFLGNATTQNLRKWGTNLEVRYQNPVSKAVSWINILPSLTATKNVNFTSFFDATTENKKFCLFVNGDQNIYEWTGAIGSVASTSNAAGIIGAIVNRPNSVSTSSGGIGYVVGDVITITGGDGTATATVDSIAPGGVATASVAFGGVSYANGDKVTLVSPNGANAALIQVTSNSGGAITGFNIISTGIGYGAGFTYTTSAVTGSGSTATITVNTIGNTITSLVLKTNGTTYGAADNIATTGGTGTGATVSITSVATNAIVLSGNYTTAQLGFYDQTNNANKFSVLINGIKYNYTGANANGGMTLVGISSDPTVAGISVGDAVVQVPVIGASKLTANTTVAANYTFDLIATFANSVYYGSFVSPTIYITAVNTYNTATFTGSGRLIGEGAVFNLDAPPVGFIAEEDAMYVTAGRDFWYRSTFTLSSDLTKQNLQFGRLHTATNQGAQTQALITKLKNSIVYVSNEPIVNSLGPVKNVLTIPQVVNMSDPIKYDVDAYNFANGSAFYWNYFIYICLPVMGIVRIFNVNKKYWEAPQVLPFSRFYSVNGVLYAHSGLTNESYQAFVSGLFNDNGNPINAVAAFPYVASGAATNQQKFFNKFYTEGYIAANTSLTITINYDFGGFTGNYSANILGTDAKIIFNKITDGSLGKNTLGSEPIGAILNLPQLSAIPKFRIINTFTPLNNFEYQVVYSSNDTDQNWALLRFGPAIGAAHDVAPQITE